MKPRKQGTNSRRKPKLMQGLNAEQLEDLVCKVSYKPHPKHKSNPHAYKLIPSSDRGTLCEISELFKSGSPSAKLKLATALLEKGIRCGLVSNQWRGGFPRKIWAVGDNGEPFEAKLDNQGLGNYHGFPLLNDSNGERIIELAREKDCY